MKFNRRQSLVLLALCALMGLFAAKFTVFTHNDLVRKQTAEDVAKQREVVASEKTLTVDRSTSLEDREEATEDQGIQLSTRSNVSNE